MKQFLMILLFASSCATPKITDEFTTGLLDPMANTRLSDHGIFKWAEKVKGGWGQRSMNAELFDVGGGLTLAGLSTAVLATSNAASRGTVTGLSAAGNFVLSAIGIIKPAARDNAFNVGGSMVSMAEGTYLKGITAAGLDRIPVDAMTPQGAMLYDQVNAAITVVGNLMVGLMPKIEDVQKATDDTPITEQPKFMTMKQPCQSTCP